MILVSDPAYPHAVGRAHFKLLWSENGEPVLWLEKLNKDFRADVDTGPLYIGVSQTPKGLE